MAESKTKFKVANGNFSMSKMGVAKDFKFGEILELNESDVTRLTKQGLIGDGKTLEAYKEEKSSKKAPTVPGDK